MELSKRAGAWRATQSVTNQPPPLVGYNLFREDRALHEALVREGGEFALSELEAVGELSGSEEAIRWGFEANESPPKLHTHDRYGNRIDEVEFHPSWHCLMEKATRLGLHASPWRGTQTGAHVARAAAFYLWSQAEAGHGCPISMTCAAVPTIRSQHSIAREWEPVLTSLHYDPVLRPVAEKRGALCGMAMTEKQGGSDVRANQTRAIPLANAGPGEAYLLTGHKWFCSAPMCDAFLTLAQTGAGISCFLLPRILPDGERNSFRIQRLKDKLGNRSNASSEVEFDGAYALLIGEEGRGIQTIVEMVNYTRLDCINGAASLMRQAVAQATHHAAHRSAFGRALIDQELMQNVLADLALESEAATLLLLRLARAVDRAPTDAREATLKRLGTALGKYWTCKRAPVVVGEALECLGGNGYVEESIMPRLYREAPLNSIWEGCGNINALDVVRILSKRPEALDLYFAEIEPALAMPRVASATNELKRAFADTSQMATQARMLVERMALLLQAALLVQHSPHAVADAFCASRLGGHWGHALGTLPPGSDFRTIIDRARPHV